MATEEQMINITPERLKQLKREEAERVREKVREENKPEWLLDRERAERIGRSIMVIFSWEGVVCIWIPLALFTILINLF